ncbi:hypothetical protein CEE39_03490 [bacterium (candidate division B38) B3_B38]|nr:MAG: hypothetical protein CEE39_03490 [bacterium (candidate division B38) B3_B38]
MFSGRGKKILKTLLGLNDTVHRTALAFALGIFIGLSPLLGLQTLLALFIAFAFKLNRAAVLVGTLVNNPWTIPLIYPAEFLLGASLLGSPGHALSGLKWGSFLSLSVLEQIKSILLPIFFGYILVGIGIAIGAYFVTFRLIFSYRQKASLTESSTQHPGGGHPL